MKLKKSYFHSFDKTNKILFVVLLVLSLIFAGIVLWKFSFSKQTQDFYGVYLKNGELYFGTLSKFPSFSLSHVYVLQNQGGSLSIQKFSNVFWSPEDNLKINKDEVVWYVKLNPSGTLAQTLKTNPNAIPSTQSQIQKELPMESTIPATNTATSSGDIETSTQENESGAN
jgi:hypothetical protein